MSLFRIVGKNPILWFYQSLRRCGLGQTLMIIWTIIGDVWFDFRYGTDTLRRVPRTQIETDSENKVYATGSGSTKVIPFLGLMRRINLPADSVFLDLGSGKGRVVMLAAKCGFRKVIGVDFSRTLCEKARANLQKFLRKCQSRALTSIVESDVTTYQLADDETVFFMYDPFNPPVLTQVLRNIRASLERRPRPIWLIYSVPRERQIVDQCGVFSKTERHVVAGSEFLVYSNEPASAV
jgi:SAM-dependent methyltransferase